jgi:hypothetical protein
VHPFPDAGTDCLEVGFGSARANHKEIGKGGNLPEVEHDDFLGLFVFGKSDAELG